MYHGWQFDGAGKCAEQPPRTASATPRTFQYGLCFLPIRLIFAYMGDPPTPEFELVRKDVFEGPDRLMFARDEPWPCNWFQQVENSLDATHVSFVHHWGSVGRFGQHVAPVVPTLEYFKTESEIGRSPRAPRTAFG